MPNTTLKWKTLGSIHLRCIWDSVSNMSFKGEDSAFVMELLNVIETEYKRLKDKEEKDGS